VPRRGNLSARVNVDVCVSALIAGHVPATWVKLILSPQRTPTSGAGKISYALVRDMNGKRLTLMRDALPHVLERVRLRICVCAVLPRLTVTRH
jgi:hypothetical protein